MTPKCPYVRPPIQKWPHEIMQTYGLGVYLDAFLWACVVHIGVRLIAYLKDGLKPYAKERYISEASMTEKLEAGTGESSMVRSKRLVAPYDRAHATWHLVNSTATFIQIGSSEVDGCRGAWVGD